MEDINKIWHKIKKGIKEAAGKIIGKEKRLQRNSCFDEERKIMLADNKTAYSKIITEIPHKMNKNIKRKQNHKKKYLHNLKIKDCCLNQAGANGNCL